MYLKITNEDELHNGLQYHDGLVEDILPFRPEGSCVPGGIYFTTPEYICGFIDYGVWVREVTVPEDAQIVKDPSGDKWRANKVVLGTRKHLKKVDTWKWLVENGVKIHARNDASFISAVKNGYLEVIKYLVEHGSYIHASNDLALISAAESGHIEVVKCLIEIGADIHARNDYVVRNAAENGYLEVVKFLVEQGSNIHALNDYAFRSASAKGHLEVVKYLVEHGANIHALNDDALRWSARNGHTEVVDYLKGLYNVSKDH